MLQLNHKQIAEKKIASNYREKGKKVYSYASSHSKESKKQE